MEFTNFLKKIIELLPDQRLCLPIENVVMNNHAGIPWFTKELEAGVAMPEKKSKCRTFA